MRFVLKEWLKLLCVGLEIDQDAGYAHGRTTITDECARRGESQIDSKNDLRYCTSYRTTNSKVCT